ncbi:HTH domain-containing protein [Halalkalicoccus jeotgali]|uniref:Uncharacterized protein n=1 Tax=Halalkalicoccus jeotgali (strain DSM 18796 / CECT 7217 / JCM 14584 / KCTC 4019 / B3) TaxID=795797 RepID=D8J8M9_HALJB|nr:HTH domain-containing protein [Halalkalicoccus jeotgali]ADJ14214.1 hypothetical protein HacjB3_04115 [Halalkalicoccus jeotgali B3]ELY34604.1 hypothetical protein C497_15178 [Halalkalicoccus jeotgali B3]
MKRHSSAETYRAEIVLRSLAPHGVSERQGAIIERVENVLETGLLEAVDVEVWGREMQADPAVRTAAHERYEVIESWAAGRNRTLTPGFDRQRRESIVDDRSEEVISFPLICLVVYAVEEDDEDPVRAVFPCSDGEQTYTVMDGIATLERWATDSTDGAFSEDERDESEPRPVVVGSR